MDLKKLMELGASKLEPIILKDKYRPINSLSVHLLYHCTLGYKFASQFYLWHCF
jgi:hypothetical protein